MARRKRHRNDSPEVIGRMDKRTLKRTRFDHKCRYCGNPADTWDHAIPKSRGGSDEYWKNLFPCCSACNHSKGDMTHDEYLLYLERDRSEEVRLIHEINVLTEQAAKEPDPRRKALLYEGRLVLCVYAANIGVSLSYLAILCGQAKWRNDFRKKLIRRGYVPKLSDHDRLYQTRLRNLGGSHDGQ